MIVWVCSYPRSGNTFLRIVLKHLYGIRTSVVYDVVPHLRPLAGARIPSFDELRGTDDRFFRRGRTGSHRDELPEELHAHFWSRPDNREALRLLGYH